jgi:hypothetical protein
MQAAAKAIRVYRQVFILGVNTQRHLFRLDQHDTAACDPAFEIDASRRSGLGRQPRCARHDVDVAQPARLLDARHSTDPVILPLTGRAFSPGRGS